MVRIFYCVFYAGTGLVTSNIPLFLNYVRNVNYHWKYSTSSTDVEKTNTQERDYTKREHTTSPGVILVTAKGGNQHYLHISRRANANDFSLDFWASKNDYLRIPKSEIKIKLFKNPAWLSANHRDEYEENGVGAEELFGGGQDEEKVKQLLLSLSIRKDWDKWYDEHNYWGGSLLVRPTGVEDLRDLKIKYFRDFSSLKDYVKRKVRVCMERKEPCYAKPRELNILDQDKIEFFS